MDLSFSHRERELAREYGEWLRSHFIAPSPFASIDEEVAWGIKWQAQLAAERWVAIDWPAEHGGRSASPLDVALVNLEYGRSGAPQLVNRVGLNLAGPTLLSWGTEEQRARWLPKILSAEEIWCQLFSEPGAGSDLASLRTRASAVDGGWVISGQKVWTSYAQHATWGLCLARTNDTAKPQAGISYFVVNMKAEGITIRPLRQITGDAEFNEVFLDDVFVPEDQLVGPVDKGWTVAGTTLAHERGTNFPIKEQTLHERHLAALTALPAVMDDPLRRLELAQCYIDLRMLSLSNLKTLAKLAKGGQPGAESSVTKLQWTRLTQRLSRLWYSAAPNDPAAHRQFLWSFVASIAGGTSEIQLNIIADRILGLPRG